MKRFIFILLMTFIAFSTAVFVGPHHRSKVAYTLGTDVCTYGPSYWCKNLTAAADCRAVKHCIQTVWVHQELPPDTSSVCQTCLDMVKQARDQLESNETQELIKEVFDGSCALLKLKPIVKECDKIANQYIPELIDTLASEMNPQVVCSVAGLCNNEKVHQMLVEAGETMTKVKPNDDELDTPQDTCANCHTVVDMVEANFRKMSRDDVLDKFLMACGKMGSFSDACSNIILTYFTNIYNHLQENLNSENICLLAGECSAQFHKHATIEITPMSKVGFVKVQNSKDGRDDLPCELCEQLVRHLRDLLVTNTTEDEFKEVMQNLCKQTGTFSKECVSLVNEYYPMIYDFLVNSLNATVVCDAIGICKPGKIQDVPFIAPILPVESVETALKVKSNNEKLERVPLSKSESSVRVISPVIPPLPIDLMVPPHQQLYNQQFCVFCEYFLHFVQQQITNPATEEQIKEVLDKACDRLPRIINDTCTEFVSTYEPALVAILAQEIDPSQVCPLIKVCPSEETKPDVEVFMQQTQGDSKCPLCLLVVTELEDIVKNKKTEDNIKDALNKLCSHLPQNLEGECSDFINTYSGELIAMLIADLQPQEVCVYLKLCTDSLPPSNETVELSSEFIYGGDVETNSIRDYTINGHLVNQGLTKDPQCVLCEFVMKEIDDQLKNNKTEDEIKKVVEGVCKIMPRTVKQQCKDFVEQYADMIIVLLQEALEPSEICSMLKLCDNQFRTLEVEIFDCAVCEATIEAMDKILSNPNVDHNIEHILEKTCRGLPKQYKGQCVKIIEEYGNMMIEFLTKGIDKRHICSKLGLCKTQRPMLIID